MYCETDVKIPDNVQFNNTYTLYWVWQWTSLPGKTPGLPKGKDEYYSTCMDVDIEAPRVAMQALSPAKLAKFAMGQQDAVSTAVSDWAARTALYSDLPLKREMGPVTSSLPGGGMGGDVPIATGTLPGLVPSPAPPGASVPISHSTLPANGQVPSSTTRGAVPTPPVLGIPALSGPPGVAPTASSGSSNGVVIVTTTVRITVTAPAATQPVAAAATPRVARSIHHKNGAKFRGLLAA
ncbi:uncharacterized protein SETTUDRAFT_162849 [Exserohilum turcica Et28A]|uniref:DUF7492 domain-containing protein n=1 Tax=Exserohilum turcicum (strain 28A) TaxID=671987 RepID=R0KB70_EXST2|nr:uncharacterized protein SETTUDRAFT_162849 [Exserohilum turcica Et28A]EOA86619.1 hypothetical protein SETTUDRAFT_162849 [Exserohilum turcica Et28A]